MSAVLRQAPAGDSGVLVSERERFPVLVLTDQAGQLTGAVAPEAGLLVGRDAEGRVLFRREGRPAAVHRAVALGHRVIPAAWHLGRVAGAGR